jgi:hypothetical protein
MLKKIFYVFAIVTLCASNAHAVMDMNSFNVRPITSKEFFDFLEVFGSMRGPLRVEILKDRKTDFENADPLKYLQKIKGEKKVKKALKKNDLTWDQFMDLTGNILLAYYTIQPDETKVAIIRRLADYGLELDDAQIPPEYRDMIREVIKTDAGAMMASVALDMFLQVPQENIDIVKRNKLTLDKQFYTRFWKDKI